MGKNPEKKISKKFSSFTEEEQWLQTMLQEGWILIRYDIDDEDGCQYVFRPIANKEEQKFIYKVDFRDFSNKRDFQEYKELFADAGWTVLSKSMWYSKHIFYTDSTNSQRDIFSDQSSYIEREKRKMSSSLTTAIISFFFFIVAIILFIIFDQISILGGAGTFLFILGMKALLDYFRHRKSYKALEG